LFRISKDPVIKIIIIIPCRQVNFCNSSALLNCCQFFTEKSLYNKKMECYHRFMKKKSCSPPMGALRKKLLFTGIFAGNGSRKSRKEGREVHMLKVLGAQVKEFKKASILTPIFMILEVIMETVIPLLMASII